MFKSFSEMPLWQKSLDLSAAVHKLTADLPRSEDYGLTSQIRRSANSVTANIAEGFGRKSNKDKCQFYFVSRGSVFETQSHLLYGLQVGYFKKDMVDNLVEKYSIIVHELNKLVKTISNPQPQPQP